MATTTRYQKPAIKSKPVSPTTRASEQRERHRQACRAVFETMDCFRDVLGDELEHLVDLCVFRAFPPGVSIISERQPGDFFYVVFQGSLSLSLHDKEGHEVLLGVLDRGDCFGEGPLFGDLFRGISAQTITRCYMLQFPLSDVRTILAAVPSLEVALRRIYRRRLAENALANVPLFNPLSSIERSMLAELLQPTHYERGSTIVQKGKRGQALYLIESGQLIVEEGDLVIATLDEGDFFGEMALLFHQPHSADVRTMTPVDVLALPADDFEHLLAQHPDLKAHLDTIVDRRRANNESLRTDHERSSRLMLAVERGLLRGSHMLVRDLSLCPDECTLCVTACTARHGHPRLRTNGVLIDAFDIVDTCRQCRVGAECVEACPEDAFEWANNGALIINDKCTGCGACVPACPYDAVQRVPRTSASSTGPLWQLWRKMKHRLHQSTPIIPLESVPYTHRADKCDLCHGYDDLACVSACPTGALRLVPVEELFPL